MAIAPASSRRQASAEALLSAVQSAGQAGPDDAALLRAAVRTSGIDPALVERLIEIDRRLAWSHPEWQEAYVETLAPAFLSAIEGSLAKGCRVDERSSEWLLRCLGGDPLAVNANGARLCLRLFLRADQLPDKLRAFVFALVTHRLLHDRSFLRSDGQRRAGSLDALDVQLLRKLVYGSGGQYPVEIDRLTVNFLIDLHRATRGGRQAESWRELLCQAVTDHVFRPAGVDPGRHAWVMARLGEEDGDSTVKALLERLDDPQYGSPSSAQA